MPCFANTWATGRHTTQRPPYLYFTDLWAARAHPQHLWASFLAYVMLHALCMHWAYTFTITKMSRFTLQKRKATVLGGLRNLKWLREDSTAWQLRQILLETPRGSTEILILNNSRTAQWKNSVPVSYRRATLELSNGGAKTYHFFAQGTFSSTYGEHAQKRSPRSSWMSPGYMT